MPTRLPELDGMSERWRRLCVERTMGYCVQLAHVAYWRSAKRHRRKEDGNLLQRICSQLV